MIKLKLLIFALIVLGPCACAYARKGWGVGRTLPAALCAQSLALIVLGYFLPFSAGIGAVALVSAGMWIYALVHARSFISKKAFLAFFIPCAFLFFASVFLYDTCIRRIYISYDEHSHWGMIVKAIALFDELPRMGRGASYVQYTYPPSAAMLPAAVSTILGYRDGTAYLGYAMLLLGLLFGLAAKVSRGVKTAAACAMLYLVVMVVFPMSVLRLFVEPAIALLMALLILGALDEKTPIWEDILYAVMLAMMKNTGLVFVILALAVRLFVRPKKGEAAVALSMLAISLAATASYSAYCHVQGIEAVISPSHFAQNIRALMDGTIDPMYLNLPQRFLQFFVGYKLSQAGIYVTYGFGTCAHVMCLMLGMSALHVCIAREKRQALRLWGGVWLCNLLYMAMIVASYFISFEPWEVERLAEADRYTILVALWTGVLACALIMREQGAPYAGWKAAAALTLAAVLLPLSHTEITVNTFITRDYVHNTIWARAHTDDMTRYLKSELAQEEDPRVLVMGEYNYVELHYTLAGSIDIGRLDKSWQEARWTGSCEAVQAELADGGYAYVFVADTGSDYEDRVIDGRYTPLNADGTQLEAYSLYRVDRGADGSVKLAYLSTMPEQEQ